MTSQYGFYFDASICSGCRACQMVCRDKNNLESKQAWRQVIEVNGGNWTAQADAWKSTVFVYNLSMACNHCENAICVTVCPTKSISKREDGIVVINQDTCAGCRYCEWACPYGAPRYNEKMGTMSKCDLCFDRVEEGLSPACVSVCGLRALEFGEISGFRDRQSEFNLIYPLPEESLTNPSLVIKPHKKASQTQGLPATIANREEVE